MITASLACADWLRISRDATITTAALDSLVRLHDIVEPGSKSWHFKNRA
ncbi:hypothetical protein [Phreatobacter sp.]|nr:hypothetical protein [Phreatobacter sp.]